MMSREHSLPWDDEWEAEERKPVPRQPKPFTCKHEPGRIVIRDGYGEWVHDDTYLYQCNPSDPDTTFAEVAI